MPKGVTLRSSSQPPYISNTVQVKRENIVNGDICCLRCTNVVSAECGCNMVACRNHSSQFVYFCIHGKQFNDNGMEYATCDCARRNTRTLKRRLRKYEMPLWEKIQLMCERCWVWCKSFLWRVDMCLGYPIVGPFIYSSLFGRDKPTFFCGLIMKTTRWR